MVDIDEPIAVPGDLDRRRAEARRDAVEAAAIAIQWWSHVNRNVGPPHPEAAREWVERARGLGEMVEAAR